MMHRPLGQDPKTAEVNGETPIDFQLALDQTFSEQMLDTRGLLKHPKSSGIRIRKGKMCQFSE